jgi:hypothetical protein
VEKLIKTCRKVNSPNTTHGILILINVGDELISTSENLQLNYRTFKNSNSTNTTSINVLEIDIYKDLFMILDNYTNTFVFLICDVESSGKLFTFIDMLCDELGINFYIYDSHNKIEGACSIDADDL